MRGAFLSLKFKEIENMPRYLFLICGHNLLFRSFYKNIFQFCEIKFFYSIIYFNQIAYT